MKILVLNGSPHPQGSTKDMVNAFKKGAESAGHIVDVVDVCKKKIGGCLACEYCHSKGHGECIQKDDMQEVYNLLKEAEMLVIASPIYYHGISRSAKMCNRQILFCGISERTEEFEKSCHDT